MADLEAISGIGKEPIPGDSPTGMAVRYEPEFEDLQAEIEKLTSVTAEGIRWPSVVDLSRTILQEKSKDLLVAAYLAGGLLGTDGYPGLAAGLGIFRDVLETFWEDLFPPLKKIRGREAAVRWLVERGALDLSQRPEAADGDREALQRCADLLDGISTLAAEKFPEGGPAMGELSRAILEKIGSIGVEEEPEPEPEVTDAPPPEDGEYVEAPVIEEGGFVGAPEVEEEEVSTPSMASPEEARDGMIRAAEMLRGSDPTDPLPWAMMRVAAWGSIVEIEADENGEVAIEGGDPDRLKGWEKGLDKRRYAEVMEEAEGSLWENPLWLDLNLVVVRAMEGLGPDYDGPRAVVEGEMASLLRRVPDLADLKFQGGTPLAGESTRVWIRNEILTGTASGEGEMDPIAKVMQEARKRVSRRQLAAAVEMVRREADAAPPGRIRFRWQLSLGRLLAEAGREDLALPILQALDGEAREHRLDVWDPALATDLVALLWRCASASKNEAMASEASLYHDRLCRLDIKTAMALDAKIGKGGS